MLIPLPHSVRFCACAGEMKFNNKHQAQGQTGGPVSQTSGSAGNPLLHCLHSIFDVVHTVLVVTSVQWHWFIVCSCPVAPHYSMHSFYRASNQS